MAAKTDLNAVVQQRFEVAPGLMVIRVAPDGWRLPEFSPGQFAVLGLPPEVLSLSMLCDTHCPVMLNV